MRSFGKIRWLLLGGLGAALAYVATSIAVLLSIAIPVAISGREPGEN